MPPVCSPIVLPQVDPNYWLGGPDDHRSRFSVVFRLGYWEVWDLGVADARRFSKIKERDKALRLVSSWARQPVTLSETVEPPVRFPSQTPATTGRRWGVAGEAAGRKYKSRLPPDVGDQADLHELDELSPEA